MKITEIKATTVNVPFSETFSSSVGSHNGTTRTIVEVDTDEGITGLGETYRGDITRRLIEKISPTIIGTDPFELEQLCSNLKMIPYFYGYVGFAAIAGIEMACWDAIGKKTKASLSKLLGGRARDQIEITGVLTSNAAAGETKTEAVVRSADLLSSVFGFTTLKYKGSEDWRSDVEAMVRLAESHGARAKLRIDPNGAWSVQDSLQAAKALLNIPLEWLEDPTERIEGMARLRREFPILLATNMCVVKFDDVAPAIREGAVDVILGDPHKWGGILPTKKLAAVCEAFQLGMSLHSGSELGISTAANLHIAASSPVISYAIDSLYYLLKDDIITESFEIANGRIPVPEGPGLGIDLDREKFEKYTDLNRRDGDYD